VREMSAGPRYDAKIGGSHVDMRETGHVGGCYAGDGNIKCHDALGNSGSHLRSHISWKIPRKCLRGCVRVR